MKTFCIEPKISKNKAIEFQVGKWNWVDSSIFDIRFHFSRARDHAGIEISFEILGFHFIVKLYDCRHWNYEKGRYRMSDDPLEGIE